MNIWYLNHYSGGPGIGPAYRPFNLSKAWQRQGHNPLVVMARYHHLLDRTSPLPDQLTVEGISYRCLQARAYEGNGIARVLNMYEYCRSVRVLGHLVPKDLEKPDAIIASSPHPFTVLPAVRLAKAFNATLVFEIRDLWPLSITEINGTSKVHPFILACAATERYAYRKADLISSVLPRADRYLEKKGFGHKPFVWVPNGIDPSGEIAERASSTVGQEAISIARAWKQAGRAVIVHAGSMGPPNGLLEFLDALETENARAHSDSFGVLLFGSGGLEDEIHRRAEKSPGNIKVLGRIPKPDVAPVLREVDIGYCGLTNQEALYQYGVSLNKFGDYMRAGLCCLLPIAPCGDPVSESGAGVAVGARTPEELWSAFFSLVKMSDQQRAELGEKGRAYINSEYEIAGIAKRYVDAIEAARKFQK